MKTKSKLLDKTDFNKEYGYTLYTLDSLLSVTHIHSHMHAHRVFLGGLAAAGRGLRGQESKGGPVNPQAATRTDKAEETQAKRGRHAERVLNRSKLTIQITQ